MSSSVAVMGPIYRTLCDFTGVCSGRLKAGGTKYMLDDKARMSIASMVGIVLMFGTLFDWRFGAIGGPVVLLVYLVAGRRLT